MTQAIRERQEGEIARIEAARLKKEEAEEAARLKAEEAARLVAEELKAEKLKAEKLKAEEAARLEGAKGAAAGLRARLAMVKAQKAEKDKLPKVVESANPNLQTPNLPKPKAKYSETNTALETKFPNQMKQLLSVTYNPNDEDL